MDSASHFRRGATDSIPIVIGVLPFAMVLGLTIADSDVPNLIGWLASSIVFAGAAQLTLVTLTAEGAALMAIIAAGLVINARHLMYSVALAPAFSRQPRWIRWVGPYFLVDQVFALSVLRSESEPRVFRAYYFGVAFTFWSIWQIFVAVGLAVGPIVPAAWNLSFAVPLMFLGLLISAIKDRPAVVAALAAGLVTWATIGLPNRLGILLGGLAGVAAAVVASRWRR